MTIRPFTPKLIRLFRGQVQEMLGAVYALGPRLISFVKQGSDIAGQVDFSGSHIGKHII